jgi:signal peptidase I
MQNNNESEQNENSVYKIFNQYAAKDKSDQEFEEDITSHLEKFEKAEEIRQKKKSAEELIEERKEVRAAEKKKIPLWLEIIINIIVIIILFIVVRTFVFVPFNIDGDSMEGSLHNGEFIYVDRATPYFRPYERGDIIVFIPPYEKLVPEEGALCWYHTAQNFLLAQEKEDPCMVQASYVKRVIGVPGDTIEIKGGHVYLTPKDGMKQEIDQDFLLDDNKNSTCLPAGGCASQSSREGKVYPPVPEGHYFVLGDNRKHSSDSREKTWSSPFVAKDEIVGIARFVFLSPPEERDPGFMGSVKALLGSFSGDRILHQQKILEE